ncbi:transposase [Flavobacterium sp. RSSA_27]|uniref:transposase n=1 Tax=Flavobacterium sp. RSSA_27 TaxID=3447667 RepID=UPI003F2CFC83
MEIKQPILHGNYYHIYNRGNNGIDIFFENENYYHFLRLYAKYIEPIAETYAWCLLKNHFHLLVRIKEKVEIVQNELTYSTTEKPKTIDPSRQFSHLFNAYTQAVNKRHNRTGSLFETTFERKLVSSEKYFQQLIFYIHNNPVHHGFVNQMSLYPWSSYETIISNKPTKLKRSEVIELFGDVENFLFYHNQQQNSNEIINLIIEY